MGIRTGYKIVSGLNNAFIAKISAKNPGMITDDRRAITENEIYGLMEFQLRKFLRDNEGETELRISNGDGKLLYKVIQGDKILSERGK